MDTGLEVTPSPDGRYAVHAQPWEASASQWVYLPCLLETASGARIWSPTDRRWSLDRATWQSGIGVLLRLRKFPGHSEPPFLDVTVDCAAKTASLGGVPCELAALELHLDLALEAAPGEGAGADAAAPRVDTASVYIRAPAAQVYGAFASASAMAAWLPPEGMVGEMRSFDFADGGGYRMRLTYPASAQGAGKTSADADEVAVRFVRLVPNARIEEAVRFESDDPAYAGEMRITWLLAPDGDGPDEGDGGTRVTVRCEQVPGGIDAAEHVAALQSTLGQLAAFVEGGHGA